MTEIGGKSGRVGASLGRVLLMASLRFGQSKEPSQLIAPVKAECGRMPNQFNPMNPPTDSEKESVEVILGKGESSSTYESQGEEASWLMVLVKSGEKGK